MVVPAVLTLHIHNLSWVSSKFKNHIFSTTCFCFGVHTMDVEGSSVSLFAGTHHNVEIFYIESVSVFAGTQHRIKGDWAKDISRLSGLNIRRS